MITIRNATFETNSSSCHTVTIGSNVAADQPEGTVLDVRATGEYGWEQDCYSDPISLMDYAAVAYCETLHSSEKIEEYKEELEGVKHEISRYFASRGVTVNWHDDEDGRRDHIYYDAHHYFGNMFCEGYIDHQSAPSEDTDSACVAAMFRSDPEALYNFVYGGDSSVETDNDNH